jgi:hypothetical protein
MKHTEAFPTESVASILERDLNVVIQRWMRLVEQNEELTVIPMSIKDRTAHLPKLIQELIARLRLPKPAIGVNSLSGRDHGELRHKQGYTVPMVVEESRLLQVSIFSTLHDNVRTVDISSLLLDVITIADEVDSQLKQATSRYMESAAA